MRSVVRRSRRRRAAGWLLVAAVLGWLLAGVVVAGDWYRAVCMGAAFGCWLMLRRQWIDGGLR